MTVVPFSDARSCLTDIVNEVAYAGKRVILTRKGKKLAAIVSLEDLAALERMENNPNTEKVTEPAAPETKNEEIRRRLKAKSTSGFSV